MRKHKAFVDTTILTNRLIKSGKERQEAKNALSKYEITELPVYAIKEFKAGPLDYVKYLYNKIIDTGSTADTIIALSAIGRQKNRQQTAIRTLGELMKKADSLSVDKTLKAKYGSLADKEVITYDSIKYEAKMLLYKAWKKRSSITTNVVFPLTCYEQKTPYEEKNGRLTLHPTKCKTDDCCLSPLMREKRFDLTKLKIAIEKLPLELKNKAENTKRAKILHDIGSNLGKKILDSDCRNLGDAIFALLCPKDAEILTTNIKDHKPLAEALGKKAILPNEIL